MENARSRAEAERWLSIALNLLYSRDLHGARTFAIRARDSDPTLGASDQVLAVVETLLAGETRIGAHHDWYSILRLVRYTHSIEAIADHYRRLAIHLDPNRNRIPFSDHAFRLVDDAWLVLSNPERKCLYDNQLRMLDRLIQEREEQPQQVKNLGFGERKNFVEEGSGSRINNVPVPGPETEPESEPVRESETHISEPTQPTEPVEIETTFWTSCPYCYTLYEYYKVYEECTLKCQTCRRAFHAVAIPPPPLMGKDTYFCCLGFYPLGFSGNSKDSGGVSSKWNPIRPIFACPVQPHGRGGGKRFYSTTYASKPRTPRVYIDDGDDDDESSDPSDDDSDDDWVKDKRKKAKNTKGKASSGKKVKKSQPLRVSKKNIQNGVGNEDLGIGKVMNGGFVKTSSVMGESSRKASSSRKWDLNVEFSNEAEEPAARVSMGNVGGHREEENIEGTGFFEGLDEFLSSLPMLSVVADDKAKGWLANQCFAMRPGFSPVVSPTPELHALLLLMFQSGSRVSIWSRLDAWKGRHPEGEFNVMECRRC